MNLLHIIFPILLIVLSGWFARKYNIAKPSWIKVINNFVFYISLPAIILESFWNTNWFASHYISTLSFNLLSLTIIFIFLYTLLKFFRINNRLIWSFILTVTTGNTIYMGFPLALSKFGPDLFPSTVAAATPHLIFGLFLINIVGQNQDDKQVTFSKKISALIFNPLTLSMLIGFLLSTLLPTKIDLEFLKEPLRMLAITASPLALFTLGEFMYGKIKILYQKEVILAALFKLLILPILIYILLTFFQVDSETKKISVFLSSMPTAVTAFVISNKYHLKDEYTGAVITLTTILSFVTLSLYMSMV